MINEKRVIEIMSQITAFSEEAYTKIEFLPELFKLQKELIELTFNVEHAENGDLRLWDVERHLRKMNDDRNHVADDELARFIKGNKVICNTIKAEIAGNVGEQKVFRELENLSCQNGVLHNVELEFDGKRVEIDTIVITNYAIFIVEIKNSKKDVFIDADGGFYRTGHSMHYDCNIADKMNEREAMLRKALERVGLDYLKIFKIVTFTNPRIDVENKYHYIKVCGINYLTTFIEKFTSNQWYTYEDICTMMAAVNEVKCTNGYQMNIDINDYKKDFATLMTKLEAAEKSDNEIEIIEQFKEEPEKAVDNKLKTINKKPIGIRCVKRMVAAAIGVTFFNAALLVGDKLFRK